MQLPSGVYLSNRQLHCLESSAGQPRGKKGKAWFEWANNQLRDFGLPTIPMPRDFLTSDKPTQQHTTSKSGAAGTSGGIKTAAVPRQKPLIDLLRAADGINDNQPPSAAAPEQQPSLINLQVAPAGGADHMSNGTFIVTGGTLYGPGINISLTGGTINGFFKGLPTTMVMSQTPLQQINMTPVLTNVNTEVAAAAGGGTQEIEGEGHEDDDKKKDDDSEEEDEDEDTNKDGGSDDKGNEEEDDKGNSGGSDDKSNEEDDKSEDNEDDKSDDKSDDDEDRNKMPPKGSALKKQTPAKRGSGFVAGMQKPKLRKL